MADTSPAKVISAIEELLVQERAFLRAGEIEKLAGLVPDKERLLNRMNALEGPIPALDRLRRQADQNQQLLAASARGIRAAKLRLEALMSGHSELRTYTREGRAEDLSQRETHLERKA